ncbi:cadherin-like protein 26 [Danio aesculapii]|uniref:cadherin-like protein 26 n=1 Tax=Danio aesculapii TaxID=1142201 RepID=UPI0024C097F7|nr:cadherin-like protein 26 [Danio aesculapii]
MRTFSVLLLLLLSWSVCSWADGGKIRQRRMWIIESFAIEEESPGPFPYKIGNIHVERAYLLKFELQGEGVDKDPKNLLTIDNKGDVYVHKKVDFESGQNMLKLMFEAKNKSNNAVDIRLGVEIRILDINDHAPEFQKSVYEVTADESHAQGTEVLTVLAHDNDNPTTSNGTFTYSIKSVTPKTDNVEFYIQQHKESGSIYFKGCLDYEKAQKYTILVEAKDDGEKKQFSSTSTVIINIQDGNNNLPEFTGKTGSGKVKERETGVEVLRLQVTDKDKPGSKAWIAKYTINGDKENQFKIETDPVTNEGILTVVKPMDYEDQTHQNISISVQNEVPYFSCKVKKQVPNAMWELDKIPQNPGASVANLYKTMPATIHVEDINDPPVFIPPVKNVPVMENIAIGTSLTTFIAKDMDGSHANTFKFVKGEDLDNWVTVDPVTGQVTTAKILDRESPFVINNTYKVIVYAVDDGEPQLTGTGTLFIHVNDENDNVPILEMNRIDLCLNTEPTMANITAVDLDLPPYTSPFYYELLGDVKNKWKIDPIHGKTVTLVKEKDVFSGHQLLQIKISDQQGLYSIQNLSVTVCDCSVNSNCHVRMVSKARMGPTAALMVLLAILILIVMCLLALLISCKEEKKMIANDDAIGCLITTNTENPGTDCMVPFSIGVDKPDSANMHSSIQVSTKVNSSQNVRSQTVIQKSQHAVSQAPQQLLNGQAFERSSYRSSTRRSYRNFQRASIRSSFRSNYKVNTSYFGENLAVLINQKVLSLQMREEELGAYEPHCYADEGKPTASSELDAISISEDDFHPDMLKTLDNRFSKLATISRPDLMRR